jgi:glycosyltransferase involved in cell wall biosynthesis
MNPTFTFSLVVMTYERPAALRRCLTSIRQLDYPASAYELIVVDDGSTRKDPSPLEQFCPNLHLRYKWIPHQGVSTARNTGLALAYGDRIAFLADDYALPADYLSRADSFFQSYPAAQVLTFNVKSVGSSPARHVQQLYHDLVLLQNAGAMPDENGIIETFRLPASRAAIFKRGVFDAVGPFNESLKAGEDGELGQRLAARDIPVYFMHKYYIAHHEEKGFREFLEQRKAYATSYYKVSRLAERKSVIHEPRWTLGRCMQIVLGKIVAWASLSWKYGKFLRFFFLWPGLALFLFRFYVTLCRLERIDFRKATLRRAKRTLEQN